jgi:hypothetical protein
LIKASLRKGTDKIDAEGGRIIKMYYYANKELYIIIIIIIIMATYRRVPALIEIPAYLFLDTAARLQ